MINYSDETKIGKQENYKQIIWKIEEYIERGFDSECNILGYYVSKEDAASYIQKLPYSNNRIFYIVAIGVK